MHADHVKEMMNFWQFGLLSGGFGSYLLGLSRKIYEQAGVGTPGNTPNTKEPGIGWMVGYLLASSFVGLLALVPLRKVKVSAQSILLYFLLAFTDSSSCLLSFSPAASCSWNQLLCLFIIERPLYCWFTVREIPVVCTDLDNWLQAVLSHGNCYSCPHQRVPHCSRRQDGKVCIELRSVYSFLFLFERTGFGAR